MSYEHTLKSFDYQSVSFFTISSFLAGVYLILLFVKIQCTTSFLIVLFIKTPTTNLYSPISEYGRCLRPGFPFQVLACPTRNSSPRCGLSTAIPNAARAHFRRLFIMAFM
jgi:hypothetical protein